MSYDPNKIQTRPLNTILEEGEAQELHIVLENLNASQSTVSEKVFTSMVAKLKYALATQWPY